ncbi:MAG TPA: hypothetical protein VMV20_04230 [Chitinophagaceae bacterium]|nr:hypothetical protein [Chitinophagaceae bacterium]
MKRNDYLKRCDGLLVYAGFLFFFILTRTANFSAAHDSIEYLNNLEHGTNLFVNAHLLYHITAYAFMKAVMALHLAHKTYYAVEMMDSAWAAGSMVMVFMFFRNRFGFSRGNALACTCVPALSFGFWFYATNIEVYMPPLFLLLVILYILSKTKITSGDFLAVAVLHGLAILYHQSNIVLVPVVLIRIWQSRSGIRLIPVIARYAAIGILMVGGGYLGISWFVLGYRSFPAFYGWFAGMASMTYYWNPIALSTLKDAFVGFSHSFIGGHFFFNVPHLSPILHRMLAKHSLDDEMYISRHITPGLSGIIFLAFLVFLVLIGALLVKLLSHRRQYVAPFRPSTITLTLFLVCYSVFFYFWMPSNLEFWINQSVVFWVLVLGLSGSSAGVWKIPQPWLSLVLATLLFFVNYFGSMQWLRNLDNDLFYRKVQFVKAHSRPGDIVLLRDDWQLEDYLQRYTPDRTEIIPAQDTMKESPLPAEISSCLGTGGKVFFYDEVHNQGNAVRDDRFKDYLLQTYGNRMELIPDPYARLYEIR